MVAQCQRPVWHRQQPHPRAHHHPSAQCRVVLTRIPGQPDCQNPIVARTYQQGNPARDPRYIVRNFTISERLYYTGQSAPACKMQGLQSLFLCESYNTATKEMKKSTPPKETTISRIRFTLNSQSAIVGLVILTSGLISSRLIFALPIKSQTSGARTECRY